MTDSRNTTWVRVDTPQNFQIPDADSVCFRSKSLQISFLTYGTSARLIGMDSESILCGRD